MNREFGNAMTKPKLDLKWFLYSIILDFVLHKIIFFDSTEAHKKSYAVRLYCHIHENLTVIFNSDCNKELYIGIQSDNRHSLTCDLNPWTQPNDAALGGKKNKIKINKYLSLRDRDQSFNE